MNKKQGKLNLYLKFPKFILHIFIKQYFTPKNIFINHPSINKYGGFNKKTIINL